MLAGAPVCPTCARTEIRVSGSRSLRKENDPMDSGWSSGIARPAQGRVQWRDFGRRDLERVAVRIGEVQRPRQLVIDRLDALLQHGLEVALPGQKTLRRHRQGHRRAALFSGALEQGQVNRPVRIADRQRPTVGRPRFKFRNHPQAQHRPVPEQRRSAVGHENVNVVNAFEWRRGGLRSSCGFMHRVSRRDEQTSIAHRRARPGGRRPGSLPRHPRFGRRPPGRPRLSRCDSPSGAHSRCPP